MVQSRPVVVSGTPDSSALRALPIAEVSASPAAGTAAASSPPKQQQQPGPPTTPTAAAAAAAGGQQQHAAAGFKRQANALYRKNAVYQRRNWCSNACLLSAPVFFCLMLFGIQLAINKLLLGGEDYQCGCKCTRCCFGGNPANCTATDMGTCPYDCLERSATECGVQYSTAQQAFFCAIPRPSSWPAVVQTPSTADRAQPWRPRPVVLYTGADKAAAAELSAALLPKPSATASSLLAVRSYLQDWSDARGGGGAGDVAVPGEVLSKMGLTLGSNAKIFAGLYVEPALMRGESLDALWPDGTCAKLGLAGAENITLDVMVGAAVNASNPPATARALNAQLRALTEAAGAGGGAGAAAMVTGVVLNCTDVAAEYLASASAVERALYCGYYQARCAPSNSSGPQQVAGAYDWRGTDAARFEPTVYVNDTYGLPLGTSAPTVYQRVAQALNLAVNAWLRVYHGPEASAQLVGVMETPKASSTIRLDFSSLLGPLFFTWVAQMLLPIFLMQLVYEKEKRLRMMMKMHGLGDAAYWLVTYLWFWGLYVVYMAMFMGFGALIGLNLFTKNSVGVQIILYVVFGHNMIASAFLLSCFFASARTATAFAYLVVFGTGLIGSLLLARLFGGGAWYATVLELVPSFALFRGLYELGEYAFLGVYRDAPGMAFRDLADPRNGMVTAWAILAAEWPVFMGLAWYLEQVFAPGTGNRRHPLFFLDCLRRGRRAAAKARLVAAADAAVAASANPSANGGSGGDGNGNGSSKAGGGGSNGSLASSATAAAAKAAEADVAAERERVAALSEDAARAHPIIARALRKVYPAQDGQPPKLAVRSLDLAIGVGECFGLLGPNGAGKSTSINMMVGLLEPTHGTALIGGHDVAADPGGAYGIMGVCPQHDLLWETLTGREHLLFYGRLKGLEGGELAAAVEAGLRSVNLWNGGVADKQARAYSGGMKRRLSVAIAFVGDPLVVYLDEPSTGLDPASRRNLWDVVKASKEGRGIVLTTHSMEEAETLCDRLGIFVDGRLVCIGNPKEIASRYGGYLVMTLTVAPGQEAAARAFVARLSPNARVTYSVGGTLKCELPSDEVTLSGVFAAVAGAKEAAAAAEAAEAKGEGEGGAAAAAAAAEGGALRILDWGVSNATLEEVFIKFARSIGAEAGD